MAELSWLGNLWDSLTKREEKPTGNGVLNYQPEIKPTEDVGILGSILGPAGRALQSAEAELPRSFVPSDPQYTPLVSESKFIYNKLLGEPIANLGEGMEGVAQGFGFVRGTEMGLPQLTQSGKQVVGGALEFAPVGAPLGATARRGANVAAEAVERSPLGQGILGLQEQRGLPSMAVPKQGMEDYADALFRNAIDFTDSSQAKNNVASGLVREMAGQGWWKGVCHKGACDALKKRGLQEGDQFVFLQSPTATGDNIPHTILVDKNNNIIEGGDAAQGVLTGDKWQRDDVTFDVGERIPAAAVVRAAEKYNEYTLKHTPGLLGGVQETGFYSPLERAVGGLTQQKGTGDQMLAMIQKQAGVKPEEVQWTGLGDFLAGKPSVTKSEIEDYLVNNRVELKEVRLGEFSPEQNAVREQAIARYEDIADISADTRAKLEEGVLSSQEARVILEPLYAERDQLRRTIESIGESMTTKFSQYTTPGGSNYRELLMTTPGIKGPTSHFDQPNVLAHTRVKDYTQDGQKILHVDEVQSDWHQKGRKFGYQPSEAEIQTARKEYDKLQSNISLRGGDYTEEEAMRLSELRSFIVHGGEKIPDAPFKKNWHELMTRRILQEAADKGYSRVTFTTGQTQADRYDLSQRIQSIRYFKGKDGYRIDALPKGAGWRSLGSNVPEDKLEDYVGKEIADKIIKAEGDKDRAGFSFLYNTDLKIGGEGMKGFYDNMMVKAFNKEGKKFGVKVEPYNLKIGKDGEQVWSMEIPPEMRAKKKAEGSPLFSAAPLGLLFADQQDAEQNQPRDGGLLGF